MQVHIVTGEHPFDPYYPLEVFASPESALARAVELTAEFLKAYWDIEHQDEPLLLPPEVTADNYEHIIGEHGGEGDEDGFGTWYIDITEKEVKP